jgi:tellurite resistance protein TerC
VPVPTVGIALSLSVIVGVLAITTVASLVKSRRDAAAERAAPAAEPPSEVVVAACSEGPAPTPARGGPPVRRVPGPGRPGPSSA